MISGKWGGGRQCSKSSYIGEKGRKLKRGEVQPYWIKRKGGKTREGRRDGYAGEKRFQRGKEKGRGVHNIVNKERER